MATVDQLLTSFGKLLVHILFGLFDDLFPMAVCLGFYGIHHYGDPALYTVQGRMDTYINHPLEGTPLSYTLAANGYYISKPVELIFNCTLCGNTFETILYLTKPDKYPIPYHVCNCPIDRSIVSRVIYGGSIVFNFHGSNVTLQSKILQMPPFCVYCKMLPENGHNSWCIFQKHKDAKTSLSTCVVCMEPANVMFPCRHVACCPSCTLSVDKCPICRAPFDHFKIINF